MYVKIKTLFDDYPHLINDDFEKRIKKSIRVLHFQYLWGACKEAQAFMIKHKTKSLTLFPLKTLYKRFTASGVNNLFDLIMSIYNKRRDEHQEKFLLLHCFENALRSTMAVIIANAFNQTKDEWFLQNSNNRIQRFLKNKICRIATNRSIQIQDLNTFKAFDLFSLGDLEHILNRCYTYFEPLFKEVKSYKGQNLPSFGTKAHLIATINRIRTARNDIFHNKPTKIRFQRDLEILLLRLDYNLYDATKPNNVRRFINLQFKYTTSHFV